jgi:DNA helicase-2/ATP-dependent DNA helicase PcrA
VHIERIRRFYEPILLRTYENAEARVHDVEHLGELAAGYRTRGEFLTDLVLDPPISTGEQAGPPHKDEDWLVLSTIHSAKGLEWDAVYLIHAADGCLPSDMAAGSESEIDEELRLTYVAMTRARDFLYVSWPLRYYVGPGAALTDTHTYAQCCRFFSPAVVTTMETREHGVVETTRLDPVTGSTSRKISSRIREMWQ